jgi:hypothetical protein
LAFVGLACAETIRDAYRESCDSQSGVDALIRKTENALANGESVLATQLAQKGLATALSGPLRQKLWKLLAWAWIERRDPFLAHAALLRMQPHMHDVHLLAWYLTLCNRVDEAVELLEDARSLGHRSQETTKLLIDLLFRRGEYGATLALARADMALLSPQDREAIELAIADRELQ